MTHKQALRNIGKQVYVAEKYEGNVTFISEGIITWVDYLKRVAISPSANNNISYSHLNIFKYKWYMKFAIRNVKLYRAIEKFKQEIGL